MQSCVTFKTFRLITMRIVLLLSLATAVIAQNPNSFNGLPVVNYDWRFTPNIVCNIYNAVTDDEAPGLIFINGYIQDAEPLTRGFAHETETNRLNACTMPAAAGLSYCRTLIDGGNLFGRRRATIPPNFESRVVSGNGDPASRVPLRELYLNERFPLPLFMSCDEYPFASTRQGGQSARLSCVPDVEQNFQKQMMGNFYNGGNPIGCVRPGAQFYVGIENIPDDVISDGCYDFCTSLPRPGFPPNSRSDILPEMTANGDNYVCFSPTR